MGLFAPQPRVLLAVWHRWVSRWGSAAKLGSQQTARDSKIHPHKSSKGQRRLQRVEGSLQMPGFPRHARHVLDALKTHSNPDLMPSQFSNHRSRKEAHLAGGAVPCSDAHCGVISGAGSARKSVSHTFHLGLPGQRSQSALGVGLEICLRADRSPPARLAA